MIATVFHHSIAQIWRLFSTGEGEHWSVPWPLDGDHVELFDAFDAAFTCVYKLPKDDVSSKTLVWKRDGPYDRTPAAQFQWKAYTTLIKNSIRQYCDKTKLYLDDEAFARDFEWNDGGDVGDHDTLVNSLYFTAPLPCRALYEYLDARLNGVLISVVEVSYFLLVCFVCALGHIPIRALGHIPIRALGHIPKRARPTK
jgi:hypothetical protein